MLIETFQRCWINRNGLQYLYSTFILYNFSLTWKLAEPSIAVDVRTSSGWIRGREEIFLGKSVRSFLGVPFGEAPVGNLRFRPPIPKKRWNGTYDANALSPACYQGRDETFRDFWGSSMWNANTPMTEDCLYMNIWVPKTKPSEVIPVMIWLFGGGFWYGSASLKLYDGRSLAVSGHVIVVNVNYRVGGFGFLYLDIDDVPGNVALLDQQLALQWIQENIKSFGGDRNKVTLFGESAGAASIVGHMIAPESRKLFNNGILESGSLDNPWAMDTPARAFEKSMAFVRGAWCHQKNGHPRDIYSTVDCLRQRSAQNLSDSLWGVPVGFLEFYLVIVSKDRNFFKKKDAYVALREGDYRPTDLVIGINKDEGNFWNIYYLNETYQFWPYSDKSQNPPYINAVAFELSVEKAFSKLPLLVRKAASFQYWDKQCTKKRNFYLEQSNQMIGDYFFTCDSLWLADQLTKNGAKNRIFIYYFEQISSTNPFPKWMGVLHGYEIEFVFGVPLVNGTAGGYTKAEIELSKNVVQYWSSFAKDGHPRARGQYLDWPQYKGTSNRMWFKIITNGHGVMKAIKSEECAIWRAARDIEYLSFLNGCSSFQRSLVVLIVGLSTWFFGPSFHEL